MSVGAASGRNLGGNTTRTASGKKRKTWETSRAEIAPGEPMQKRHRCRFYVPLRHLSPGKRSGCETTSCTYDAWYGARRISISAPPQPPAIKWIRRNSLWLRPRHTRRPSPSPQAREQPKCEETAKDEVARKEAEPQEICGNRVGYVPAFSSSRRNGEGADRFRRKRATMDPSRRVYTSVGPTNRS